MLNRLKHRLLRRPPAPASYTVAPDALPPRIAILLTNPRSGSTWLFDALRCHPAVQIEPRADVFRYFGMTGRRYPRDLSGTTETGLQVEVQPGNWEALPTFPLPAEVGQQAAALPVYSLEKCHPHFFRQDVDGFVRRLRQLEGHSTVRMMYQVRDPAESLISFLRYKERNPTWNTHLAPAMIPAHMRRIYESLLACAAAYPGQIVDYTELEDQTEATLRRLFDSLWPSQAAYDEPLIQAIIHATGREQRQATSFLGQQVTKSERDRAAYADLFTRAADDINGCYTAYHALLSMRTPEADV